MKLYQALTLIGFLALTSCQPNQQSNENNDTTHQHQASEATPDNSKKVLSPRLQTMANIGDVHVHIDYSSPGKRGRTIWNGLVAYGQVWVTGAHKATSIEFSEDVTIQGKTIPKGKYAFFTIPDASTWTLIINKNHEQHLADDYDAQQDVVRVDVTPEKLDETVESLTYKVIPQSDKQGFISVAWDDLEVRLPIEVQ
jgi:hypothetical protein